MSSEHHEFVDSGERRIDAGGRRLKVCAVCGSVRVGVIHSMKALVTAKASPVDTPEAPGSPPVENRAGSQDEAWQLRLLRIACQQALDSEGDILGWRLRLRVADVLSALETFKDDLPLYDGNDIAKLPRPPKPKPRTLVADNGARLVRRSINGDYAKIGLRAVEAGWLVRRRGNQHLLFTDPQGGGSFTLAGTGGEGRGYMNAKAQAKRAGLDTDGL